MGEVYRAKDTRLDRTVAIKILPHHLSGNTDFKQRFEREARAISSLTHPHICGLYDVGSQDGTEFLVMEFLEGETLAHRLTRGPLPADQMLRFGIQIADALDKAHRQGIIHRDMKPGNIMVTKSGVKLLDFGLAKLRPSDATSTSSRVSVLATEARDLTSEGTIVGTIQYMSPEQLEGREADTRTDIFAFGSVLYEMATGKKAFTGNSHASLMSAILRDEPTPISQVQPLAPPALDRVVKTCLAKDPEERWQNAHDLMKELAWIAEGTSQKTAANAAAPPKSQYLPWIIAAASLCLAAIASWIAFFPPNPRQQHLIQLSISAPPDNELVDAPAVSPDGSRIVFPAADKNGRVNLWVRSLDASNAQKIAGTEGATYPFWSGDSRFVGFFANTKLVKVDPLTGLSQPLCDVSSERGGTWNNDGVILFSPNPGDGLYRISSAGGMLTRVTSLDSTAQETTHRFPSFLPDGKHFLFFVQAHKGKSGIYLGSLDSGEKSFLVSSDRSAVFSSGYLMFQHSNTLFAQPFDTNTLKLSGDAVPFSKNISHEPTTWGSRGMAVGGNNLAYMEGNNLTQLLWFDRNGNQQGPMAPPNSYAGAPSFSPDGKKFAIQILDGASSDIWLYNLSDENRKRLSFSSSYNNGGAFRWSSDGSRILYSSTVSGPYQLYLRDTSGAGKEELLYGSKNWCMSEDWSFDNQYIIFSEIDPKTKYDLWILRLEEPKKAFPFLVTGANEANARFSPDAKWIAYCSDESGRPEVYVQPFLGEKGGKWQVSTGGGFTPRWSKDGKELFYLSLDNQIMSSEVELGTTFEASVPKPLFLVHPFAVPRIGGGWLDMFTPAPDGQRFAVHSALSNSPPNITVVLNWPLLLNSSK
jgi:eukaryotic-like serine/threonine-protein kinase